MSRTTPSSKPQTQSSRPQRKSRRATTGREGDSLLLVVRRNYKTIVEDHEDVGGVGGGHGVEKQRTKIGRRNHAPGGHVNEEEDGGDGGAVKEEKH